MKRNLLETLNTPITATGVKRALQTPVFSRRESADDAAALSTSPIDVRVEQHANGPRLQRATHYELGRGALLVHFTFDVTIELVETVPAPAGHVGLRVWHDGWPSNMLVELERSEVCRQWMFLKDTHDEHVYLTVIAAGNVERRKFLIQVTPPEG